MPKPIASLDSLLINTKATIYGAMEAINGNTREVVLVTDDALHVLGLITDGDIRRGLLSGKTLDAPATAVMTADFFFVSLGTDRAFVLDVMKARSFKHVPVLDDEGRLVAVHFLRDLIGSSAKQNAAVIMAGGKGTRLRPLTQSLPKPMVEVAGRPILERIIIHLVGHGIQEIYISVNYKAEVIKSYFGDGKAYGCNIIYIDESEPLGTGGALALLAPKPVMPFLVINGDLVTNIDVTAMLEAHEQGGNSATIGVGLHRMQLPFGNIIEKNGYLVAIEEKPAIDFLINRGIYVFSDDVLSLIPRNQEYPITALFSELLLMQMPVGVFYISESWHDVAAPEDLRRANGLA